MIHHQMEFISLLFEYMFIPILLFFITALANTQDEKEYEGTRVLEILLIQAFSSMALTLRVYSVKPATQQDYPFYSHFENPEEVYGNVIAFSVITTFLLLLSFFLILIWNKGKMLITNTSKLNYVISIMTIGWIANILIIWYYSRLNLASLGIIIISHIILFKVGRRYVRKEIVPYSALFNEATALVNLKEFTKAETKVRQLIKQLRFKEDIENRTHWIRSLILGTECCLYKKNKDLARKLRDDLEQVIQNSQYNFFSRDEINIAIAKCLFLIESKQYVIDFLKEKFGDLEANSHFNQLNKY